MKRYLITICVVATMILAVSGTAQAVTTTGLWLMDDNGMGANVQEAIAGNTAYLQGVPTDAWSTNTPFAYSGNHSIDITGGGADSILIPAHAQFDPIQNGDFTVSFWLQPQEDTRQGLFSSQTDCWFGLDFNHHGAPQNVCLWANAGPGMGWNMINADGGGNGIGGISLPLDDWSHVVATREGDVWKTYINTAVDLNITVAGTIVDRSAEYKYVGRWADIGNVANGLFDELVICDYAWDQDEVDYWYTHSIPSSGVPEPMTLSLLGLGSLALLRRRR